MESRLRQRVIGAIVLTSVAILLLPVLLDGSAEDRDRAVASIPVPPKIELKQISVSDITRKMQQMERDSAARLPREVVDETDYSDEEGYGLDQNDLPIAWSLQLGSFRNQENAEKLRAELREANFRSYILQSNTSEGQVFKVFVGPRLERLSMEEIAEQIQTSMNLEGHIVRYRVEEDTTQLGG